MSFESKKDNNKHNIMDYFKNHPIVTIICLAACSIFFFPPLINILIKTPSLFGFILKEESIYWIGYYAAIIGGLFTIISIIFTINYNDKIRKENLSIEYRPIFSVKLYNSEIFNKEKIKLNFKITNIGRGEAYLISVNVTEFSNDSSRKPIKNNIVFLAKDQSELITYLADINSIRKLHHCNKDIYVIDFNFQFIYKNIFNEEIDNNPSINITYEYDNTNEQILKEFIR